MIFYFQTWQWSIGTASLFFGWINLALYLQKFPTIGIYIMMFKDILNTFLEFVIVYVLFVIAFALAFYNEIRSIVSLIGILLLIDWSDSPVLILGPVSLCISDII